MSLWHAHVMHAQLLSVQNSAPEPFPSVRLFEPLQRMHYVAIP